MDSTRKRNTASGFTLIELVVVVMIIGILAAASVPVYRGYLRRATLAEGRSVAGSIATAQKIYYNEYLNVVSTGTLASPIAISSVLGIDVSTHKYFDKFCIPTSGGTGASAYYTGYIYGDSAEPYSSGITVTVIQTMNSYATISDNA